MAINDVVNEIQSNPEIYASNAHGRPDAKRLNDKTEKKKLDKVVSGSVSTKKKGEFQKFKDSLISEDTSTVKSHIVDEVIVPSLKKLFYDAVKMGVELLLWGETGRSSKSDSRTSKVSYRSYYENDRDRDRKRTSDSPRVRSGFDFDDILFENRADAESLKDTMIDVVDQYGKISVLDMYDLAGITTTNYAVQRYGWYDLKGVKVVRVRDGYMLNLPKAEPLN